jgi:hypothetical protein
LVTIFRFLLNVSDPARHDALDFAAQVLQTPQDGLLVAENHGPSGSLRGLGRRRNRANRWFAELSHRHLADLLSQHGFRIVAVRGFGICPSGVYRSALRPVAQVADHVSQYLPVAMIAANTVYIAQRVGAGATLPV